MFEKPNYPKAVKIVEVGARDGLQNEAQEIPIATKAEFINRLTDTGLSVIETGSLVSPKWVPQMAGSIEVFQEVERRPSVRYPLLVPNEQGLDAAIAANIHDIAIFAAASETFSQKNINCSIDQSLERYQKVVERALAEDIQVRGYVSCVVGCPYEGAIDVRQVVRVATALLDMGCYEVSLGDTIGVGTPNTISTMLAAIMDQIATVQIALHCHDTYGMAIANIHTALTMGVAIFDSSVAGLGGCPYAPGASGNVATEDVLFLLQGLGIPTGIDLNKIIQVSHFITGQLGIPSRSKAGLALTFKQTNPR